MSIDFAQPVKPKYTDSSAAAIATCGILEIMKYVSEGEKDFYRCTVERLMGILQKIVTLREKMRQCSKIAVKCITNKRPVIFLLYIAIFTRLRRLCD